MFPCAVADNLPIGKVYEYAYIVPTFSYPYICQVTYYNIAVCLPTELTIQDIFHFSLITLIFQRSELCGRIVRYQALLSHSCSGWT